MLKGENVVCGTSTTGTGTLTLAATPKPPGGADFYAAFSGQGLGTTNGVPVSYTIMEYTDSTFVTAKQSEKGFGLLLIGANIGATTLARTTIQQKATGLDSTPTYTWTGPPTAITIGTAANTLVFIGASAYDIWTPSPYVIDQGNGFLPFPALVNNSSGSMALATTVEQWVPFEWVLPIIATKASVRIAVGTAGGVSNLYLRLYAIGSDGKPGKKLVDFGVAGTAAASLTPSSTTIATASGGGYPLLPGSYYMNICPIFASGSPTLAANQTNPDFTQPSGSGRLGSTTGLNYGFAMASTTSGNATAPDTANVTGWTINATTQALMFSIGTL